MNDLWTYEVSTNIFTWIRGSSSFDQQQQNCWDTYYELNEPGVRYQGYGVQLLGHAEVLMFGGFASSIIPATMGFAHDLWSYSFNKNQFRLLGGSCEILNYGGFYGELGTYHVKFADKLKKMIIDTSVAGVVQELLEGIDMEYDSEILKIKNGGTNFSRRRFRGEPDWLGKKELKYYMVKPRNTNEDEEFARIVKSFVEFVKDLK